MAGFCEILLNMSITGSVVIAVIILVRFLLKGMPKKYSYILWGVAGFRLCCPVSFKSIVSIFNINPVQRPSEIVKDNGTMNYIGMPTALQPDVNFGVPANTIGGATGPTEVYATNSLLNIFIDFLPYIWLGVFILLTAYGFISYIKLKHKLATATKYDGNIYQSDCISSPFILGIIRPKIYIPYDIEEDYLEYVIAHEKYHLKRADNIIKLLAFFILAMHWFNPLCWVAFYLLNKDMEMSCDEWVLAHNENIKKQYSSALLSFATGRKFPSPSPLCFGEGSAKSRIKNVLKYKKPTIIITVIAAIICIVIAVVCIADPKSDSDNSVNSNELSDVMYDYDKSYDKTSMLFMSMAEEAKKDDYSDVIADISSPDTSNKYYKALIEDKDITIRNIFDKFCQGRRVNADGALMRIVMDKIIGGEAIKSDCETGQEYFDLWAKHYIDLKNKNGEEFVKEKYPYAYIFLTEYADKMTKREPVDFLRFFSLAKYECQFSSDKVTFKCNNYDDETKCKVRWVQNYFDPQAVSAELIISYGGKEIYNKPLEIVDVRPYVYNNDVWDYIIEIDSEITAEINPYLSSLPGFYVKIIDSNNTEYHIMLSDDYDDYSNELIYYNGEMFSYDLLADLRKATDTDYTFIFNKYWYRVFTEEDETVVAFNKYNSDGNCECVTYTRDDDGKWWTEKSVLSFSFDENDTIVHYQSDNQGIAIKSQWHINKDKRCIEELDRETGETLVTLTACDDNSLDTAKKLIKMKR